MKFIISKLFNSLKCFLVFLFNIGLPFFCLFFYCAVTFAFPSPMLWIIVFILLLNNTFVNLLKYYNKNIPALLRILSHFYFFFFLVLVLCATSFCAQLHPFLTVVSWMFGLVLYNYKHFSKTRILEIINVCFAAFLLYDVAGNPYTQAFPRNTCVQRRVSAWQVRNIFTDNKEKYLYFTVHHKGGKLGSKFKAFFKFSLDKNKKIRSLSYYFCHNGIYDEKSHKIYLVNNDKDELLMVSPETLKILAKTKILKDPTDIFMDEKRNRILVLFEEGMLAAYHPNTLKPISSCYDRSASAFVQGILTKHQDKLYVARGGTPWTLIEADMRTCSFRRRKFLGMAAFGIAADQKEKFLYVTDFLLGKISMIDRQSFKTVKTAWLKSGIRPIEIDEKRKLVYVANYFIPELYILNKDFKLLKKVSVGNLVRDILLLKNGRLFAATSLGLVEVNVDDCLKK